MNVLTINCGSSSLKMRLCAVDELTVRTLVEGAVEAIGADAVVSFQASDGAPSRTPNVISDHAKAFCTLLDLMGDDLQGSIEGIGHRVVQGGAFSQPIVIDEGVLRTIDAGRAIAPLHNKPSLDGIMAARDYMPDIPMVAVFDAAFHSTMPAVASQYALPQGLTLKYGLWRHGYHGIAHRSMAERYAELTDTPHDEVSIITLQLGSGCSATAVRAGVSVDTSMGFTPLEGLMMGTRPGDLDPGVLSYLLRDAGLSLEDVDGMLNRESGLLGVSGSSGDMSVLLREEAEGHPRAHDAIELFCYRVRKYIGAYFAVLGDVQAVVFGGGIGERSPDIRRRICEPLMPLGLQLDAELNAATTEGERRLSHDGRLTSVWAIPSDEERIIARDTFGVLSRPRSALGT